MKYACHIFLTAILFLVFTPSNQAQKVQIKEARTVAIHFLNEKNIAHPNLRAEIPLPENEKIHVFNFRNGFILTSNQMEAYPIIAWSDESNFPVSNIPDEISFWLKNYSRQLNQSMPAQSVISVKNRKLWKRYLLGNFRTPTPGEEVKPLIQASWNQGCYFNSGLPVDSTLGQCNHPYTGCVPAALAQVMDYYKYPAQGMGGLTIDSPYGPLTADFENTTYQWVGMENQVLAENPAVAELLYHCVVAVKSQFFPQGTGAYDEDAMAALTTYFDYANETQFLYRDTYPGDWLSAMRTELDEERPILYGGVDESNLAGHTFVCDGYKDSTFFHINWGWGGQYNGYFYLDTLVAGGLNYNFLHDAIIGIRPNVDPNGDLYPPANLSAEINSKLVSLSWDAPWANSYLELIGYNIYRDDSLLNNSVITNLFYDEPLPSPGNHHYSVQSVFIGNGNGPSTFAEIYVSGIKSYTQYPFHLALSNDNTRLLLFTDQNLNVNDVRLLSTSGTLIFDSSEKLSLHHSYSWSIPPVASGIYLFTIKTKDNVFVEKLLIN